MLKPAGDGLKEGEGAGVEELESGCVCEVISCACSMHITVFQLGLVLSFLLSFSL